MYQVFCDPLLHFVDLIQVFCNPFVTLYKDIIYLLFTIILTIIDNK